MISHLWQLAPMPHASPCGMTFQGECSESFATQMTNSYRSHGSKTARKTGHIHLTTHTHIHPPSTRIQSTKKRFTHKKRTIYVAGGRFSTAVARILALNLQLLRPNVMLLDDLDQKDKGCLLDMNRRSVFMVFDFARYQKNIIRAAHVAKQKGATIVLISDGELSPIKTDASIVLPISTDSFLPLSGMATATAIIEILLSDVYAQIGSSANEHLTEWELLTGGETVV